jgi:hypothetical protein
MVYNTQNYWVYGLCPSSCILKKRNKKIENTAFRKLYLFPSSDEGSLERANLNHWMETDPVSETLFFSRIQDDGQNRNPSNSECYTPTSKPFRINSNEP